MSYHIQVVGKTQAVSAEFAKEATRYRCPEPEESTKMALVEIVKTALAKFPSNVAVRVSASGSQYTRDHTKPEEVVNQLKFEIEPISGFVE